MKRNPFFFQCGLSDSNEITKDVELEAAAAAAEALAAGTDAGKKQQQKGAPASETKKKQPPPPPASTGKNADKQATVSIWETHESLVLLGFVRSNYG